MTLGQLLVLYFLAGGAVAVAFFVTTAAGSRAERLLQFVAALAFWPLYLTLLLSRSAPSTCARRADQADDELVRALAQVESALQSLDDWEDGVRGHDRSRLDELHAAVERMAAVVEARSAAPQDDERVKSQAWPGNPWNSR
jgi:hypothetical protein